MNHTAEEHELPRTYDGTQLVIQVRLPHSPLPIADLYEHVYGMHLNDGAKPWPYYRDAATGEWWSLSTSSDRELDALAWMIPLDQLRYKPRPVAEAFLKQVYADLSEAAQRFRAEAVPECGITDALHKMDRVAEMLSIRDYKITIIVRAPEGSAYSVTQWWQACEAAGLQHGDGDLFWLFNKDASADDFEPLELFPVEPYSQSGYFHPADRTHPVTIPDVALYFRVRDFSDSGAVLLKMAETAARLGELLGAAVVTPTGDPFELPLAQAQLKIVQEKLRSLKKAV